MGDGTLALCLMVVQGDIGPRMGVELRNHQVAGLTCKRAPKTLPQVKLGVLANWLKDYPKQQDTGVLLDGFTFGSSC